MLSSTRLLSLALLLVSAVNTAAAPTPLPQDRQLPGNVADGHAVLMGRATPSAPAIPPAKATAKAPSPSAGGSKPPPAPPTSTVPGPKIVDCASCIENNGHFDKLTFTCAPASENLINKVTTTIGCPQMLQMQTVFPKTSKRRAGVVPPGLGDKFTAVTRHIFTGDSNNPNAGRHTLSSFLATHASAKPVRKDDSTKILEFIVKTNKRKTVWQDGAGGYDRTDIRNMCTTAAQILTKAGQAGGRRGVIGAVVQSPFGTPVCITFAETNGKPTSCFPIGISTTVPLGQLCHGR